MSVTTMGVDQVAGGLDVRISSWPDDSVGKTPLFAGKLYGYAAWLRLDALMDTYDVTLAVVDPNPDRFPATQFAARHLDAAVVLHEQGGQHSADSLDEDARRRLIPDDAPAALSVAQVIDPIFNVESGLVTFRVLVEPGHPLPVGVEIRFKDTVVLDAPGGAKMVEAVGLPETFFPIYE